MAGSTRSEVPLPLPLEAEEYLTWLAAEKGRSPATLSAYRRDLRTYARWLHSVGVVELQDVGTEDLVAYVEQLRDDGRAPSSVARALVAVRGLHRFLASEDLAPADPASDLEPPQVPRGLPRALGEDEVILLLGSIRGDDPPARRDRAMLEVLYGTGVRISELVGTSLSDLDLSERLLRVTGKGARERVVPLGRPAAAALSTWLGEGGRDVLAARTAGRDPGRSRPSRASRASRSADVGDADAVFLNARGRRLGRQGAWGIVRRHAVAVGLGDRMSPHVLRHSCATHMLDHGADVRAVQELLGHASIGTTQVYTLVSTERLRSVYDSAHPRARR